MLVGLLAVSALAWAYLVYLRVELHSAGMGTGMAMQRAEAWTAVELGLLLVMWAVMMVAMMVPTETVAILAFAAIERRRRARDRPYVPTAIFLGGYVAAWTGFSVLASGAQWGLHRAALLSPMGVGTSPILGGLLLLAAGLFQWTPFKKACLAHCRSPMGFLVTHWREGRRGAFVMGLWHGIYCTGCCWLLMALLFVAGVMNLLWIAALTAFVLVEKLVAGGDRFRRAGGAVLAVAGIATLLLGVR